MTTEPLMTATRQMPSTAPDQSTTGKHLPALDGVRGLAIAMVLLVHLFVRNPAPAGSLPVRLLTAVLASGWTGVQLFFVLSGFLITGILYDTREGPHFFRNFYARRALRIFPLYYAVIGGLMLVSLLQGYHWFLKGTFLYLSYLHTLVLGPVIYTDAPWVNINHLWSLAIEEQFYFLWPVCVFLLRSRRRIAVVAVLGAVAALLLRVWLEWAGVTRGWGYAIYSWSPSQFDSLLLGAALAMLVRSRLRGRLLRLAPSLTLLGGVVVLAKIAVSGALTPLQDARVATVGYTVLALTFCGLIASALRQGSLAERCFRVRWLGTLGRYSYGLYVYHFPIHQFLGERVHGWAALHTGSKLLPLLLSGTVTLAVSVAVAAFSFHLFEQPILRLKRFFPATGGSMRLAEDARLASQEADGAHV